MQSARYHDTTRIYSSAEIKATKAARSARENYGDNAVGYVEIKRDGDKCIVKGKVTSEHKSMSSVRIVLH
ncbi:hypothetical protein QE152_g31394 [Popillia japonica]|uniref:Uncharacterized protein n=1 Tax=Popillia japonica TaxID=7064 RepID=A0AAW1J1K5_POPJA